MPGSHSQTRAGSRLDSLMHWTDGARFDTARAIGERLLRHDSIRDSHVACRPAGRGHGEARQRHRLTQCFVLLSLTYCLLFYKLCTAKLLNFHQSRAGTSQSVRHLVTIIVLNEILTDTLLVALTARQLLDEIGIDKLQTEVRFKHTPYWNPIRGCALHCHLSNFPPSHLTAHVFQLAC